MCTPRDGKSDARSTHADSSTLLRGHVQPSVSESQSDYSESIAPSTTGATLGWQTHTGYAQAISRTLRSTTPKKLSALTSRRIYQKSRPTKIRPESIGVQLQHLESTSDTVTHQNRLESSSSSSGNCRSSIFPTDGVWSPPATPRGRSHHKRCGCLGSRFLDADRL